MKKCKAGYLYLQVLLFVLMLFLIGCQKAYYKTMEAFGYQKRDLLVERVKDARDAQETAKEQFKSALEKFSEVVEFKGGELEEKYKELKGELERSETKAKAVKSHIDDVEEVAADLFNEWESELSQYSNNSLRRSSEQKLELTRRRYAKLIGAMKRAEEKIGPVLTAFRDQVLFLKHNLNAQAVASLQNELTSIKADIESLIKEMEASIAEASSFIRAMGKG